MKEDVRLTIRLKDDYQKINKKSLIQLKTEVLRLAETVNINQISLEASESSENFRGSSGGGGMLGNSSLLRMMGMGSQTEKVIIKGQDFESMANFAEYLKYQLDDLDNISNSHISVSQGSTVSKIFFDQYLMGMNEVEPSNVSQELSNFQPQSKAEVKYKAGNQEYDILIRDINYDEDDQKTQTRTLEDLRNLEVTNKNNGLVQLRSFSRINLGRDKGNITRINQEKEVNLVYMFNSDINESKDLLEAAREEIDELVQSMDVPTGIAVEVVHEENEMDDFIFLILAAFILIYMILAAVFESTTAPIVLMFTIPLAAIGSLLALLFTSNSLMNANVFVGFIILIGIVVNNSIILIDYTSLLRRNGNRKQRAIITAGLSRLRPILITGNHDDRGHDSVSYGARRIRVRTGSPVCHHRDRGTYHEYAVDSGHYPDIVFRNGRCFIPLTHAKSLHETIASRAFRRGRNLRLLLDLYPVEPDSIRDPNGYSRTGSDLVLGRQFTSGAK